MTKLENDLLHLL